MRARKHPNLHPNSFLETRREFKEQHVCTVLAEVESNLRFMCLAMDATRFNAFNSGEEDLQTALGLLEAFYLFVDGQADILRSVLQELPLFTFEELDAAAHQKHAAGQEAADRPKARMGLNAGDLLKAGNLRTVKPITEFNATFGDTVAPENVG